MRTRWDADRAARHLLPAMLVAIGVEIGVRLVPLPRLARAVGVSMDLTEPPHPGDDPIRSGAVRTDPVDAARVRAAQIVLRHWPWGMRGPCLRQALVTGWMLRRRRPRLVLGAASEGRGVVAHAWLLVDGVSLDPDAARWTPLTRPRPA